MKTQQISRCQIFEILSSEEDYGDFKVDSTKFFFRNPRSISISLGRTQQALFNAVEHYYNIRTGSWSNPGFKLFLTVRLNQTRVEKVQFSIAI